MKVIESKASEESESSSDDNKKIDDRVKTNFLNCTKSFAQYQKKHVERSEPLKHDAICAMTSAVKQMAEGLSSTKTDKKPRNYLCQLEIEIENLVISY